eukprot:Pompholyxophrys_punicea_v1_NODE_46_length_4478_cov_10.250283.p3 type:complete len:115 gc:universal NODE_46_length_4478_cov_10.250283:718-1062(+)
MEIQFVRILSRRLVLLFYHHPRSSKSPLLLLLRLLLKLVLLREVFKVNSKISMIFLHLPLRIQVLRSHYLRVAIYTMLARNLLSSLILKDLLLFLKLKLFLRVIHIRLNSEMFV